MTLLQMKNAESMSALKNSYTKLEKEHQKKLSELQTEFN